MGDPGYWVNVYSVRRLEGRTKGEWYNAGEIVATFHCDDDVEAERTLQAAEREFADLAWGNIYSVRGGVAIQVLIEGHEGRPWPNQTP